jgi:transposase-like protein
VTSISVKRWVKKFREEGPKAFYAPRPVRGAAVLVEDVVAKAEELLAEGAKISEVAGKLNVKKNTLQKAVRAGRVREPVKKKQFDAHIYANGLGEDVKADRVAETESPTATAERRVVSATNPCGVGELDCIASAQSTQTTERLPATTKSARAEADCAAPMGRGATATLERLIRRYTLVCLLPASLAVHSLFPHSP